jgi:PIN domain nuclease of toxin-antitoxin system
MTVFDSSALLAFLRGEEGASVVESALRDGGVCGAANWSEVAQKVERRGASWATVKALLLSYPLAVEPVTVLDAETAAALWSVVPALSLADRLGLALAARLGQVALTADAAWTAPGLGLAVELIR